MLQVAINPLLRVAGGEEHFAFNSAFAQFVFGAASFHQPKNLFVHGEKRLDRPRGISTSAPCAISPANLRWVSIYWIFAVVSAAVILILLVVRFPHIERTEEEQAGTVTTYFKMLRSGMVWAYFACMFAYVGSEQGTSDWMSKFLAQYHGYDPHTTGADAVSWFWGMMTAGCFLGMILFKAFDSRRVLLAFAVGALIALSAALFGPATVSLYAFPLIGFFASIMWPTIISLAPELGARASRFVRRNPLHRDYGRRGCSTDHWPSGRPDRVARWNDVSLHHLRLRADARSSPILR